MNGAGAAEARVESAMQRKRRQADREIFERQAVICKAFASPVRIHLLDLLGKGERSGSELLEELQISKTNLSQHLSILRAAGVVVTRRDGKQVLCSLAIPEVKQACELIRDVLRAQIQGANKLGSRW